MKDAPPLALFTAGAPGAGKSELVRLLAAALQLTSHDPDDILTELAAAAPRSCRLRLLPQCYEILDQRQDDLIAAGTPLVVNSTAADFDFIRDYRSRLVLRGYACAMVMVQVPLALAIARNRRRPHPIPEQVVRQRHAALLENKGRLRHLFEPAWWVVDNAPPACVREAAPRLLTALRAWLDGCDRRVIRTCSSQGSRRIEASPDDRRSGK